MSPHPSFRMSSVPTFPNMDTGLCLRIQEMARLGLTKDEILEGYALAWEQLTAEEQSYFDKEFKRGVLEGKIAIANDLTKHSAHASGLPATMAYLRRFVRNYEKSLDSSSDTDSMENFHFFFNQ